MFGNSLVVVVVVVGVIVVELLDVDVDVVLVVPEYEVDVAIIWFSLAGVEVMKGVSDDPDAVVVVESTLLGQSSQLAAILSIIH